MLLFFFFTFSLFECRHNIWSHGEHHDILRWQEKEGKTRNKEHRSEEDILRTHSLSEMNIFGLEYFLFLLYMSTFWSYSTSQLKGLVLRKAFLTSPILSNLIRSLKYHVSLLSAFVTVAILYLFTAWFYCILVFLTKLQVIDNWNHQDNCSPHTYQLFNKYNFLLLKRVSSDF
jgi:hypothetical protein